MRRGFTLIELLVVIAIISLLSSVALTSLGTARAKARDAKRMSDLRDIQLALEMYYDKYGTYKVAGCGYFDGVYHTGTGWLARQAGTAYPQSVTRGLYEEGFLGTPTIEDPSQNPPGGPLGYMIYLCDEDGSATPVAEPVAPVYVLAATKEYPATQDLEFIQTTCRSNLTYGRSTGPKTYAVTNKNF